MNNIGIMSQSGHIAYGIRKYVLDDEADVEMLSLDDTPGSEAFVIENGKRYILNNNHEWKEKLGTVGGGGGCDCEALTEAEVLDLLK